MPVLFFFSFLFFFLNLSFLLLDTSPACCHSEFDIWLGFTYSSLTCLRKINTVIQIWSFLWPPSATPCFELELNLAHPSSSGKGDWGADKSRVAIWYSRPLCSMTLVCCPGSVAMPTVAELKGPGISESLRTSPRRTGTSSVTAPAGAEASPDGHMMSPTNHPGQPSEAGRGAGQRVSADAAPSTP